MRLCYPLVCLLILIYPFPIFGQQSAADFVKTGDAKRLKGDYDDAIADYTKAIQLNPNDAVSYVSRALANLLKRDDDGAISDSSKAIELSPQNAMAYVDRGSAKEHKGDHDGALSDYNRAIELDPNYGHAFFNRAILKDNVGDYDAAIADSTKAIELEPKLAQYDYVVRGISKFHKADYDGAITDYNQAIKLAPQLATGYIYRGWLETIQERYDVATADFNKAIELSPKLAYAVGDLGLIKQFRGDWESALTDFLQYDALSSNRNDHDAAHLLIWVARARMRDTEKANQELSDYLASRSDGKPEDWSARVGAFLVGRMAESEFIAAANSIDAKKNRDQHCKALYYIGLKQLLAGNKKSAADNFTRCLATGANHLAEFPCARFELQCLSIARPQ